MVISEDIALDRNPREELEFSGNEQTEVATDKVDFSPRFAIRSGVYGLADRNNGFFLVVKRRTLTTLPSLLSDFINSLQKLKGTGTRSEKKSKPLMNLLRGSESVWLLTPLRVRKRSLHLKRTYELLGSLWTSMDSG